MTASMDDFEASLIPPKKHENARRFITFNVNGVKTLFNYYPWNKILQNYDTLFNKIGADVISFQELKLSNSTLTSAGGNITNLKDFQSFITIPKSKRGYSGVGVFVRTATTTVLKAEEGITGWLRSPDDPLNNTSYRDLDPSRSIGGYPNEHVLSKERALELDSEGRCISIEIPNNIVVISVYCPANSMGTDEGELFRMDFLKTLLQRCYDLKHSCNKEVILMGDINVCLDLIDSAEGIQDRIKSKLITILPTECQNEFESKNLDACIDFKNSKPSRLLLNNYTFSSLNSPEESNTSTKLFYDTTRYVLGRKMNIYTVWNTMTNARLSNFGSRIDLILSSSENLCQSVLDANICPLINGSDHCPVYCDFQIPTADDTLVIPTLKFEAQSFFKITTHRDISLMFSQVKSSKPEENENSLTQTTKHTPVISKRKREYISRKVTKKTTALRNQQSISNFFFSDPKAKSEVVSLENGHHSTGNSNETNKVTANSIESISTFLYGEQPKCLHDEPCQLKTSLNNPKTRGKKFWCCPRNLVGLNLSDDKSVGEHRCNYFEWTKST